MTTDKQATTNTTNRTEIAKKAFTILGMAYTSSTMNFLRDRLSTYRQLTEPEMEHILAFINEYKLNPLLGEFNVLQKKGKDGNPPPKGFKIAVGLDGWIKRLHTCGKFGGASFQERFNDDGSLLSVTCKLNLVGIGECSSTEYFQEVRKNNDIWRKYPIKMTSNRAFCTAVRFYVGIAGIVNEDDASEVMEAMDHSGEDPVQQETIKTIKDYTINQLVTIAGIIRGISGLDFSNEQINGFDLQTLLSDCDIHITDDLLESFINRRNFDADSFKFLDKNNLNSPCDIDYITLAFLIKENNSQDTNVLHEYVEKFESENENNIQLDIFHTDDVLTGMYNNIAH